jgi:hypothetical protein
LDEVRSRNKLGVEWRHQGKTSHEHERYSVEQGLELKWSNAVSTGVSYRRRDDNDGPGDHDDGLFIDLSFPLWKRPKEPDDSRARIAELEKRIAELESRVGAIPDSP